MKSKYLIIRATLVVLLMLSISMITIQGKQINNEGKDDVIVTLEGNAATLNGIVLGWGSGIKRVKDAQVSVFSNGNYYGPVKTNFRGKFSITVDSVSSPFSFGTVTITKEGYKTFFSGPSIIRPGNHRTKIWLMLETF